MKEDRYFRCIGLREKRIRSWNHNFMVGEVYRAEVVIDDDGTRSIYNEGGIPYWVDADQFVEVTGNGFNMKKELIQFSIMVAVAILLSFAIGLTLNYVF